MKKGKYVKRRIHAIIFALVLVLPVVCGRPMPVRAVDPEECILLEATTDPVRLEIGDTVTLDISFNTKDAAPSLDHVDDVCEIIADLDYDTDCFYPEGAIGEAGWLPALSDTKVNIGTEDYLGKGASGKIASIIFKVKKAVDTTTEIKLMNIDISRKGNAKVITQDAQCTLTNSASGTRNVTFSMPASFEVPLFDGETASLPINVAANSGFNSLHIYIKYLPSLLVFKGLRLSDVARSARYTLQTSSATSDGDYDIISLCFVSQSDITATGVFAYVDFSANRAGSANASVAGAYVTASVQEILNESLTTMSSTLTFSSEIKFTDNTVLLGDVNNDGFINLIDATWVLQAYNGARVLTEDQIKRADVNKSNSVTLVDALLIMKFYNHEITQFPVVGGTTS